MKSPEEIAVFFSKYLTKKDLYYSDAIAKISAAIILKRLDMGMTQKEFAAFMGVSQGMISKWESSDYNFTIESLSSICERLSIAFSVNLLREDDYFVAPQGIATDHSSPRPETKPHPHKTMKLTRR